MSTTSSMLNEEFGYVRYDDELLTKLKLYTSEHDDEHDELTTTTCNCNNYNNHHQHNGSLLLDDNADDFHLNDNNCCAVALQQINTNDCGDNNNNIQIPTTTNNTNLATQSTTTFKQQNEITTRQSSQQIICSPTTITPPVSTIANDHLHLDEQSSQVSLKSDCDYKNITNICNEVKGKITNGADSTSSSLLIRRRQSYLVISIDYQQKIDEELDNQFDNNLSYETYREKGRRPTIQFGDIEIIPTENPILNDRRLSQISSASSIRFNNQTKRLSFMERMSALVTDSKDGGVVSLNDLPMTFQVKYLGHCPAKGLWGIKHTRGPVDTMVKVAKNLPPGQILPIVRVTISTKGITITQQVNSKRIENCYAIETISYGVQDLVYTRVFSMIVVYENMKDQHPFECHAFVCESRNSARRLTYALAAAFQDYSKRVQENMKDDPNSPIKKKFAIDLRTPEEIQEDIEAETEA